jgi:5,10-methylenetetrahydromethanopterin reductase
MTEFWRAGGAGSLTPAAAAAAVEAEGWDGQMFMDSQSLGADPYVLMGHWSAVTERIRLATGVTNPVTRHPAVTAASAVSVQAISGGRCVLGVGRGDSALAYLGRAPAPLDVFEATLTDLQTLLSGGEIDFGADRYLERTSSVDTLALGDRPTGARLRWVPPELPKVPLDVAATGPRVIAMAARVAERVTFSVGAVPERVRWAIDQAESARVENGGTERPVSYGVQVAVVCHRDVDAVREVAGRIVLPLARFQVLHGGAAAGPKRPGDDRDYDAIRRGYAMTRHSRFDEDKLVGESIDFDFVRRFAVVGTPEHCVERLIELSRLGIDRFVVFGPGFHDDGSRGASLFATEVMPAVRAAVGADKEG